LSLLSQYSVNKPSQTCIGKSLLLLLQGKNMLSQQLGNAYTGRSFVDIGLDRE